MHKHKAPFVTSGLRIKTPAITSRGMMEEDMIEIAHFIASALKNPEGDHMEIAKEVRALTDKYPIYA